MYLHLLSLMYETRSLDTAEASDRHACGRFCSPPSRKTPGKIFWESQTCGGHSSRRFLRRMAGSTGLEPAASAVTGQRSNQLNYDPACAVATYIACTRLFGLITMVNVR